LDLVVKHGKLENLENPMEFNGKIIKMGSCFIAIADYRIIFLSQEIEDDNETAPHFDDFPIKLHRIFQIFQLAMFDYQIQNEPT
jgi:hypothetical protein